MWQFVIGLLFLFASYNELMIKCHPFQILEQKERNILIKKGPNKITN